MPCITCKPENCGAEISINYKLLKKKYNKLIKPSLKQGVLRDIVSSTTFAYARCDWKNYFSYDEH